LIYEKDFINGGYVAGYGIASPGKKCFAVSEMKDAGRTLMKKLAGIK